MNATVIGVPSRNQDLGARLAEARRLTDELFSIVRPDSAASPIDLLPWTPGSIRLEFVVGPRVRAAVF